MTYPDLRRLILGAFVAPRDTARALIALNLPMAARWWALALVMTLSALLSLVVELALSLFEPGEAASASVLSLVVTGLIQGGLILYGAWAMTFFGRMAGGRGTFADALILAILAEFILLIAQCAQFVVMMIAPFLSVAGAAALVALLFYLLTQFTAALHGFDSLLRTALAVIAVFFGTAMVAGTILISLGFVPTMASL